MQHLYQSDDFMTFFFRGNGEPEAHASYGSVASTGVQRRDAMPVHGHCQARLLTVLNISDLQHIANQPKLNIS